MRSAGECRTANTADKLHSVVFGLDVSLEVGVETSLVATLVTGVNDTKMFTLSVCLQSSVTCCRIITGVTLEPYLMMKSFYVLIKIGFEGECFVTDVAVIFHVLVNALIMSFQASFTGGFIWTLVTAISDFLVLRSIVLSQINFM